VAMAKSAAKRMIRVTFPLLDRTVMPVASLVPTDRPRRSS
jgi:hypothetical protein